MRVSFDPAELDLDLIHAFLSGSYWAGGIPRHTVERAIAGSLCVGAYAPDEAGVDEQIGLPVAAHVAEPDVGLLQRDAGRDLGQQSRAVQPAAAEVFPVVKSAGAAVQDIRQAIAE